MVRRDKESSKSCHKSRDTLNSGAGWGYHPSVPSEGQTNPISLDQVRPMEFQLVSQGKRLLLSLLHPQLPPSFLLLQDLTPGEWRLFIKLYQRMDKYLQSHTALCTEHNTSSLEGKSRSRAIVLKIKGKLRSHPQPRLGRSPSSELISRLTRARIWFRKTTIRLLRVWVHKPCFWISHKCSNQETHCFLAGVIQELQDNRFVC